MKKHEILVRVYEIMADLYDEVNGESWTKDEELYEKEVGRFAIVNNLVSEMLMHIYNNEISKEELKNNVCKYIDKWL